VVIGASPEYGVRLSSQSVLRGCYIGLDLTGTFRLVNAWGDIDLEGADECVIGGSSSRDRNVICGGWLAAG
jgi:hypothetical protein